MILNLPIWHPITTLWTACSTDPHTITIQSRIVVPTIYQRGCSHHSGSRCRSRCRIRSCLFCSCFFCSSLFCSCLLGSCLLCSCFFCSSLFRSCLLRSCLLC